MAEQKHVFYFVGGGRCRVRPEKAARKVLRGEWRRRAKYEVEAGSVVVHEYEKVPAHG